MADCGEAVAAGNHQRLGIELARGGHVPANFHPFGAGEGELRRGQRHRRHGLRDEDAGARAADARSGLDHGIFRRRHRLLVISRAPASGHDHQREKHRHAKDPH